MHSMKQVKLHYSIEFISTLLTQWVFTLTPIYYVLKGQFNPLQLILIGVVLESTVLLFEVPTGYLADRKSRVLSFAIGYGLMGLSFGILVYQPNFIFSLMYSFLLGLGYTFVSGAQTAWILDESEESTHQTILIKASQYGSIGGIVGIGLAVIISLNTSIEASIFISGCGLVLLSLGILVFAKETNYVKHNNVHSNESNLITQSINLIKSSSILKSLIIIALFYGFASEGFDRLWGLKVFGSNQLTEIESVWVIGGLTAIVYFVHVFMMKMIENRVKKPILFIIILNSILVFTIILFAQSSTIPFLLLFYSLSSTLRSINYPMFSILNNQYLESYGRATLLSFFGQMDALGQIVGGLIIGFFANQYGVEWGLILTALLHCMIVYALIRFNQIRQTKSQ